jgi:putative transposase
VQFCIFYKLRNSMMYVPWKERKMVARDLRDIYAAFALAEAEQAIERISAGWDAEHPAIGLSWRADWRRDGVFNYAPEVRKVIYTTDAVESLNYSLR